MSSDTTVLMKDYVKKFRKLIYWPLKFTGFCRFDIVGNEIVQLTSKTIIYNVIILLVTDCIVVFLLYSSIFLGSYLKIPDGLCISHFAIFANIMLLNLRFLNRHSGLELINNCIKVDSYLGAKETTFLRQIAVRTFVTLHSFVTLTNICGGIFLYSVYKVSISIHIVGSLYFFWLFFAYDDYCFGLMLFTLNSLRIRYLNVALLKFGGVNYKYLPKQSLFYIFFWKEKFNRFVMFHNRAGIDEFNIAYRMCFDMLKCLERFYNFPFLYGILTIVVGSFVAVQTFIMRVKNTTSTDNEHTYIIVGWVVLTWGFLLLMTSITDTFSQQIQQTKLICCYIQLKPNKSAVIYKLTNSLLEMIEMRNVTPNIYGMFSFDSGFIMRMAASTLVYITVQLQLAFPRMPLSIDKFNETMV